jgi:hypothetical protein
VVTISVAFALGLAVVSGLVAGLAIERLRNRAATRAVMRVNRAAVLRRRGWQTSNRARNIAAIVRVVDGLAGRGGSVQSLQRADAIGRAVAPHLPAPLTDRVGASADRDA